MSVNRVRFSFTPDEQTLHGSPDLGGLTADGLLHEDDGLIIYHRFYADVGVSVDGVELYGWQDRFDDNASHFTLKVPLLVTAFGILDAVRESRRCDDLVSFDPEEFGEWSMAFRRNPGDIAVRSRLTKQSATAPFDEWERACLTFQQEVRAFLLAEFPALIQHPELGSWFRGEVDLPESWT